MYNIRTGELIILLDRKVRESTIPSYTISLMRAIDFGDNYGCTQQLIFTY